MCWEGKDRRILELTFKLLLPYCLKVVIPRIRGKRSLTQIHMAKLIKSSLILLMYMGFLSLKAGFKIALDMGERRIFTGQE